MKSAGLIILGFFPLVIAHAFVASSSNYRLEADSINVGGVLSTSSGYRLQDTAGEVGTGLGTSTIYTLKAGYQQMVTTGLSLSVPGSITLLPNIPDTGGSATGQGIWTVITDNPAGYTMNIRAAGNPALSDGGNSFANYTPAGANPDFTFSILSTVAEFGFTPEGAHITARYIDNGVTCNSLGGDTTDRCWDPLLTTDRLIAQGSSANHPLGTPTTVKFQAENGTSNIQPAGSYTATATVTVLAR